MNVYELQQLALMGYPSGALQPTNTTTKKVHNYIFKLNEVLGKGNFSTVYKGINELNNEQVAIKVVELSSIKTPALVELLYSEIDILKTLNHPNILRCYEVFTSANNCYIITEMCTEGDLETRIRARGPIPEREASKTIYETFQGLKYLAEQSIVHRDFKVANILFNKGVAKIADFGFAKRTRDRFKDINIGSPIYMSPEGLLENIYGPKTDVWAFGVFMYELIHGDTPLAFCQNEADLRMHIMSPLRSESFHPSVSMDLRDLIRRCLEVSEHKRISIHEIEHTPFMKRIALELGMLHPLEAATHTKSGQKLGVGVPVDVRRMASLQDSPFNSRTNFMMPSLQRGMHPLNSLLSPDNKISNSPRVGINGALEEENRRKNLSFQNFNQAHNQSKRGFSMERANFGNLKPYNHNATSPNLEPLRNDPTKSPNPNEAVLMQQHSYKIVPSAAILTFNECVNLLHYCRLSYKVASILAKLEKYVGTPMKEYFINWLFHSFGQVEAKIPSQVKFEGEKAQLRERKLQEVISEYHKKYFKDLKITTPYETSLAGIQQAIVSLVKVLDEVVGKDNGSLPDRKDIIVAAHFLMFMFDTNQVLEKSLQQKDYTGFMKKCNIEQFLSLKKQNYDENSYRVLRTKMGGLGCQQ